jgi:predicted SprT family Zn-dependent metalloprotease
MKTVLVVDKSLKGIKTTFTYRCDWCGESFQGKKAIDAHRIEGKTIDPKTNKPRMICPK